MHLSSGYFHTHTTDHNVNPFSSPSLGQNGRFFAGDIFRGIFVNEKCVLINISLKLVLKGLIDNNPALVKQKAAGRRLGDKPLAGTMLTRFTDAYMRQ